jgi:hypothetical protein
VLAPPDMALTEEPVDRRHVGDEAGRKYLDRHPCRAVDLFGGVFKILGYADGSDDGDDDADGEEEAKLEFPIMLVIYLVSCHGWWCIVATN